MCVGGGGGGGGGGGEIDVIYMTLYIMHTPSGAFWWLW